MSGETVSVMWIAGIMAGLIFTVAFGAAWYHRRHPDPEVDLARFEARQKRSARTARPRAHRSPKGSSADVHKTHLRADGPESIGTNQSKTAALL